MRRGPRQDTDERWLITSRKVSSGFSRASGVHLAAWVLPKPPTRVKTMRPSSLLLVSVSLRAESRRDIVAVDTKILTVEWK